jgi:hypothetical protein
MSTKDVDVLVIGGGPAGVGAAFSAARLGARALVIEQFNCLGGVATAGGHAHMSSASAHRSQTRIAGGLFEEVTRRIADEGFGRSDVYGTWFEIEGLKLLYERMAGELGVDLLYHTFFCDTLVEDGKAVGGVVQNKSGRHEIRAARIIDCTGDGDAAASAGVPFEVGRPGDAKCQPVTLMFTIGGVDWDRVTEWEKTHKRSELFIEAHRNGDMDPFQTTMVCWWWTPTRPDFVGINTTHIIHVDATDPDDLTRATIEGRRQAYQCIDVFRKYVDGMQDCYMVSTPNTVGLRESRRILGDVVLTEDDIKARKEWPDSVGYGSFFIDIHNIDGPGMSDTSWYPPEGFRYQIPYRVLLPRGVENLLVAGRCISVTHLALGSTRVMTQCMLTGEAAGTAAALSIEHGVTPRELDTAVLQDRLRQDGAILDEEGIARANPDA